MGLRLLHAADIHLGFRQYGSEERYRDFALAFDAMVKDAIAREVDVVLIAGDLFHKRVIDPETLLRATFSLQRLQERGIQAIAVEGNHDRGLYQERFSWLDFLSEMGLLMMLSPRYDEGQILLEPWDEQSRSGAFVDLPGGVRILGVKYYGGSTPRVIRDVAQALEDMPGPRPVFSVLMLHAGIQGVLDNYAATLAFSDLEQLRPHCDYLALGHIHKPFIRDGWIHNPGSLETNSIDEAEWWDRGYFLIEIDFESQPIHKVAGIASQRRQFVRLAYRLDTYKSPEALISALEQDILQQARPELVDVHPVVEIQLTGTLPFDHSDLDTVLIQRIAEGAFQPIVCNVRDKSTPSDFEVRASDTLTRVELEKQVLAELSERDIRRRGQGEVWASMALRLKLMALANAGTHEVTAELREFLRERHALGEEAC